jgi:hypothetical protein
MKGEQSVSVDGRDKNAKTLRKDWQGVWARF